MFRRSLHPRQSSPRAESGAMPRQGFTLIELIMVMIIVAIMAAALVPNFRGFMIGREDNDAARQILSLTGYARTQAISEGRIYRLNLDPSVNAYWLTAQNGGQYQAPTNDYGQRFTLPSGVTLQTNVAQQQNGDQYVAFMPGGLIQPAPVTITLTDPLGKTLTVACASESEFFRILPAGETTP
jgi:type II secretion system protein H